ncbi:response regulator transcription factor [Fodinisporobacter ferrooxydans]|uniref:Response regulator transcription factor n=1 Tax=Fodinisporobacter ferrooxydans TaxID=2901836 RepID=A0ABY4CS84_9BACL|nr:response regulator transcription factor [Alicyclobacillaceae bacterium MYW30-H2]
MPIHVFVVDDHKLFRAGLIEILQQAGDIQVVGEASNGEEAIFAIRRSAPDILILDLTMPGMDGIETLCKLRGMDISTRVLVLTGNMSEHLLFAAIENGAHGYVMKTTDPDDMIEAIRRVYAGEAVVPGNITVKLLSELSKILHKSNPQVEQLTPREIDILRELSTGATNREIAQRLFISENTVRNHVGNILVKLKMQNRFQAAAFAVKEGITKGMQDEK